MVYGGSKKSLNAQPSRRNSGFKATSTRSTPAPASSTEPHSADVSMLDDEDPLLPSLAEDTARIAGGARPAIALPDAYEERLRLAREAVKVDSKRVAQVVKGWVANEA